MEAIERSSVSHIIALSVTAKYKVCMTSGLTYPSEVRMRSPLVQIRMPLYVANDVEPRMLQWHRDLATVKHIESERVRVSITCLRCIGLILQTYLDLRRFEWEVTRQRPTYDIQSEIRETLFDKRERLQLCV